MRVYLERVPGNDNGDYPVITIQYRESEKDTAEALFCEFTDEWPDGDEPQSNIEGGP